jgi:hypothetical protein
MREGTVRERGRFRRFGVFGGFRPFWMGPWGFSFGFWRPPPPRREEYLQMLEQYKEALEEWRREIEAELEEVTREIESLRRSEGP